MIGLDRARRIAEEWVAAWNAHDLDAILSHYAETLEFTSPLIAQRLHRPDGTIRSKAELREYFALGVGAGSALKFDLLDTVPGVDSIALHYSNHRGQSVIETI